MALLGIH